MGMKKVRSTIDKKPKQRLNLRTGIPEMNLPKDVLKKAADALKKRPVDGKKRKNTGFRAVQSRFNIVKESYGNGQQQSYDGVMEQSHDLDVTKQSRGYWVCSSATGSEDELSSPVIVRCVKPGDVEIVKEIDRVVYLKEYSGEEVRLDPDILFANVSEADRSRLLEVFARRPDTFMRMGSLGSFFIRFALESFSRMWVMLESTKIGDLSGEEFDDLLKSFGDMQRCLIKTDWLEALLKRIGRLKKAKMINANREKAVAEIQKLKILLSKAEEKKHKLDEEAQALGGKSNEDISLDWSVVEGLFAGRKIYGNHAGFVQNHVKKRDRGEGRTSKGEEDGWLHWQHKDKRNRRKRSKGISFAGRERDIEGAFGSDYFSEIVVMAGGTPTAVLVQSPSSLMPWETYCSTCSQCHWSLKHGALPIPNSDTIHCPDMCPTIKSESDQKKKIKSEVDMPQCI